MLPYGSAFQPSTHDWHALAKEDEVIAIAVWIVALQDSTLTQLPLAHLIGSYAVKLPHFGTKPSTNALCATNVRFFDDPVVEHLLLAHGLYDPVHDSACRAHAKDHAEQEFLHEHVVRHQHDRLVVA